MLIHLLYREGIGVARTNFIVYNKPKRRNVMNYIFLIHVLIRSILAVLVGVLIGSERGRHGRAAGMRTHILVCIGATLASNLGFYIAAFTYEHFGFMSDPLRVAAQVISGIGFLGVGTILIKGRFQITGLTTSAGLWAVGAIGLALGAGFYEGAIITFVLAMITITLIGKLEGKLNKKYSRFGIYVEIDSDKNVRKIVDFLTSHLTVSDIQVTAPRSGTVGNVGIEANVYNRNMSTNPDDVAHMLEEQESVIFALESI
jgi:putative Mg2+ transporter-C (MgtC) family protein